MAYHSTVLSQLLKIVPRLEFEQSANRHDGKRRSDALSRWSQFVALVLGQLGHRHSLRDIESALTSQASQHYHLNIGSVSRSALARANEKLDPDFYQKLFYRLYGRCCQSGAVPGKKFRFKGKLFSLDGSLVDLSMTVFPWAKVSSQKAAFKLHLGLGHDGLIPAFAEVTEGFVSEIETAKTFNFPVGSILVFDRGYTSYAWHKALSEQGLFWVTRAKKNMEYEVIKHFQTKRGSGVASDQLIQLSSQKACRLGLKPMRRVEYVEAETHKRYVFITNQLRWSARTVADIYKSRWEVELFFKWMKQNLKIRHVLGHSINAVATQVFVALCVSLLIAYLKFVSRSAFGIQAIIRLLQMNLFLSRPINALLHKQKADPPDPQAAFSLRFA